LVLREISQNVGAEPRTAREVIDQAIAENRAGEMFLYVLAGLFAAVGLSVLIWAVIHHEPVVAVAGAMASGFFWPAMNSARRTRKESIAIRLLEAPLSRADTAKEASEMLQRVFDQMYRDESPKDLDV
jgi:hypothetical protein